MASWQCCSSPSLSATSIWAPSGWRGPSRRCGTAPSTRTGPSSTTTSGPRRKLPRATSPRRRPAARYSRRNKGHRFRAFATPGLTAGRCDSGYRTRARRARYHAPMRIIGLAGWSGSGKTTLLIKVIPRLAARGLKVSTLKHAHHAFDNDQPGKDSHSHRMAGATELLIGSANRSALVHELRGAAEPSLADLLARLSPVDLVLVEGYKRERHPKLEVYRAAVGKPLLHPGDPAIVAVASDEPLPAARIPVVDLDDIDAIADALVRYAAPLEQALAHLEQR